MNTNANTNTNTNINGGLKKILKNYYDSPQTTHQIRLKLFALIKSLLIIKGLGLVRFCGQLSLG